MFNRTPKTLALLACLVAVPATAHAADVVANAGYVDGLESSCGSRVLSDHQVMVLMHALEGGVKVQPRFQDGQGAANCLVGFALLP